MNNFLALVKFEYKKIFNRKSTFAALSILLILVVISIVTIFTRSYWHSEGGTTIFEAMKLDLEVAKSKSGYVNDDFLNEIVMQNSLKISNDDNYLINEYGKHLKGDAYIKYTLPYKNIIQIINIIYETDLNNISNNGIELFNVNSDPPIDNIERISEKEFYDQVNKNALTLLDINPYLSSEEKEMNKSLISEIETPYYNDSYMAYHHFISTFQLAVLVLLLSISICVAPIFANEYQFKTDQLILTSKFGKNKIITAKLFTGISLAFVISTSFLFGILLIFISIYGSNGANMQIQLLDISIPYPITILQAILISIAVITIVIIGLVMFIMFLSSSFKSPFSVIIISFSIIFLPRFFYISPKNRLLYEIHQLFPANISNLRNIFPNYFYDIFGTLVKPATFYIVFYIICFIVLIPFIFRTFKNHQVE